MSSNIYDVMVSLENKFTSMNDCPVSRATITYDEYMVIKDELIRIGTFIDDMVAHNTPSQ